MLFRSLAATAGDTDEPIHLVGHSTGGLDARLLVSPGVSLGEDGDVDAFAQRVRSVITISTPHHGTPLASFFTGLQGQSLLRLLSLGTLYVLRFETLPLSVLLKIGAMLTRAGQSLGRRDGPIDQLFQELISDFQDESRDTVRDFFAEVGDDQALIPQLTPEAMDTFNAGTVDRPGIAYGSVVTQSPPPGLRARLSAGLSPYAQVTQTIYSLFYRQVARMPESLTPRPTDEQSRTLLKAYGQIPGTRSNDGIVPTLSQLWGELIGAVEADHLDVIGHFDGRSHDPPHVDWFATGSRFDRDLFERIWEATVRFMLERS